MKSRLLIAVPRPLHTLLTYAPPAPAETVLPGMRVSVPLGHGRSVGIVVAEAVTEQEESYTVKAVSKVLDSEPLLDESLLLLLQWAARYYHYPIGEVMFAALPTALRTGKAIPAQTAEPHWVAVHNDTANTHLERAKRQQELYRWLLQQATACNGAQLRAQMGHGWQGYLRGLEDKQLVTRVDTVPASLANPLTDTLATNTQPVPHPLQLTDAQEQCLQQCIQWCTDTASLQPILLQGVTGSGKTEIYLHLIETVLATGQQVLVLVPEIGLTPQLLQRFRDYFPAETIVGLHSGLNETERVTAWQQARTQQATIIIGTRSAVFTACPALGLIIIDEEHDQSLKQQEGFRYHGRDLAIKRAQMLKIPILLGSATPALETLHNADSGRYHYLRLDHRPGKARAPTLSVQDIRGQELPAGLSNLTLQTMRHTLERNEQVMLFINRRGFAPLLLCPACGWQAQCPACSTNMTYHARQSRLICHHCGTDRHADAQCPDCNKPQLITQGQGTERIELMLQQRFPETPVVRIDRDSTRLKGSLQRHLDTIHTTERLLLVGTQMLAKGHDFPNLTLVVVLDVDQSLLSPEYHALERFGQLMTQVAGRAGRSDKTGHVILQTTQPQHPVLLTLLQHGYLAFARQLLEERQRWQFPPFTYQALIRADALDMDAALAVLQQIRDILQATDGIILLGPVPAPLEKRANRYRAQLLLQCKRRDLRYACLNLLIAREKTIQNKKTVRWSIDIDPVELS